MLLRILVRLLVLPVKHGYRLVVGGVKVQVGEVQSPEDGIGLLECERKAPEHGTAEVEVGKRV